MDPITLDPALEKAFSAPVMTYAQVADVFNVSRNSVARWVHDGLLETMTTPGGRPRVLTSSARRFFEEALNG